MRTRSSLLGLSPLLCVVRPPEAGEPLADEARVHSPLLPRPSVHLPRWRISILAATSRKRPPPRQTHEAQTSTGFPRSFG